MLIKWVDFGGTTYTVDGVKHVANHGMLHRHVAEVVAQHYDGIDTILFPKGGPIVSQDYSETSDGTAETTILATHDNDEEWPTVTVIERQVVADDGQSGQMTRFTVKSEAASTDNGLYLVVDIQGRREHWFLNAMSAYLMSETGATVDRLFP